MNNVDLDVKLKQLGWSQRKFANRIGVDKMTVSRWITGKIETPKIVMLYLRAIKDLKDIVEGTQI